MTKAFMEVSDSNICRKDMPICTQFAYQYIPNRTSKPYGSGTTVQITKTGSNVLQIGEDRKYEKIKATTGYRVSVLRQLTVCRITVMKKTVKLQINKNIKRLT